MMRLFVAQVMAFCKHLTDRIWGEIPFSRAQMIVRITFSLWKKYSNIDKDHNQQHSFTYAAELLFHRNEPAFSYKTSSSNI